MKAKGSNPKFKKVLDPNFWNKFFKNFTKIYSIIFLLSYVHDNLTKFSLSLSLSLNFSHSRSPADSSVFLNSHVLVYVQRLWEEVANRFSELFLNEVLSGLSKKF